MAGLSIARDPNHVGYLLRQLRSNRRLRVEIELMLVDNDTEMRFYRGEAPARLATQAGNDPTLASTAGRHGNWDEADLTDKMWNDCHMAGRSPVELWALGGPKSRVKVLRGLREERNAFLEFLADEPEDSQELMREAIAAGAAPRVVAEAMQITNAEVERRVAVIGAERS